MRRVKPSLAVLADGRVLAVGGAVTERVEIWDPETFGWRDTGSMNQPRYRPLLTPLPDGGCLASGSGHPPAMACTAEVWDRQNEQWSALDELPVGAMGHSACPLPDGRVLMAGGNGPLRSAAVIYVPGRGGFPLTGRMGRRRWNQAATLLPTGVVVVTGGLCEEGALDSVEAWDPARGRWEDLPPFHSARHEHEAHVLPDGHLYLFGGRDHRGVFVPAVERLDLATGTWDVVGDLDTARIGQSVTVFPGGRVLTAGGMGPTGLATATSRVHDVVDGTAFDAGEMGAARHGHADALLPDGRVLVVDGLGDFRAQSNAEVWG